MGWLQCLVHCPGAALVGSWYLSGCGWGLSLGSTVLKAVLVVWLEVEWVQAGGKSWGNSNMVLSSAFDLGSSSSLCLAETPVSVNGFPT